MKPDAAIRADADYRELQSAHSNYADKHQPIMKPSFIKILFRSYMTTIRTIHQMPKQDRPSIPTAIRYFLLTLPIASYHLYILLRELDPVLSRFPSMREAMSRA